MVSEFDEKNEREKEREANCLLQRGQSASTDAASPVNHSLVPHFGQLRLDA